MHSCLSGMGKFCKRDLECHHIRNAIESKSHKCRILIRVMFSLSICFIAKHHLVFHKHSFMTGSKLVVHAPYGYFYKMQEEIESVSLHSNSFLHVSPVIKNRPMGGLEGQMHLSDFVEMQE